MVRDVQRGGPADKSGLKKGDIIRRVDDEVVRDSRDLVSKIASHMPGDSVRLHVFREGETFDVRTKLTDRAEGLDANVRSRRIEREPDGPEVEESSGLGFSVENLTPRFLESMGYDQGLPGVVVTDLGFDSEAADKGVRPNVVITGINEKRVRNVRDWNKIIRDLEPGDPVKLEVLFPGDRATFIFLRVPRD